MAATDFREVRIAVLQSSGDRASVVALMIAFRIVLNGKRITTAGSRGHHVVSVHMYSAARDPAQRSSPARGRKFVPRELKLNIGGLDSDKRQYLDWASKRLKAGDRLEIEVLDTEDVDPPVRRPAAARAAKPRQPSTGRRS